jgi:hypothetical protein
MIAARDDSNRPAWMDERREYLTPELHAAADEYYRKHRNARYWAATWRILGWVTLAACATLIIGGVVLAVWAWVAK